MHYQGHCRTLSPRLSPQGHPVAHTSHREPQVPAMCTPGQASPWDANSRPPLAGPVTLSLWPPQSRLPSANVRPALPLGPPGPEARQPHRRVTLPAPGPAMTGLPFWSQSHVLRIWPSARDVKKTTSFLLRVRSGGPPPRPRAYSARLWTLVPLSIQTPGLPGGS